MADATADTSKAGMGDLAEIFYAPSAVFARRTDGKFGMPYLALIVLGTILYFAMKGLIQPVIDAEITRQMAKAAAKRTMTPEAQASAASAMKVLGSFGVIMLYLTGPLLIGLFTWIVGKIAKVRAIGTVAMMVATFSFYPRLIGSILGAVLAAMVPDGATATAANISLSPARFVDIAASPLLGAIAGRLDLFIIWGMVLIAIGVRVAGKASSKQAWGTAIGVWTIPTLFAIWVAIRNG